MTLLELLSDIEARLKNATPGPYVVQRFDDDGGEFNYLVDSLADRVNHMVAWCCEHDNLPQAKKNAELIAHAPTDIAKLLEAVRIAEQDLASIANISKEPKIVNLANACRAQVLGILGEK